MYVCMFVEADYQTREGLNSGRIHDLQTKRHDSGARTSGRQNGAWGTRATGRAASQLAKETATEQTTSRSGCKPAVAPHASMAHTTKCSQRPWGSRSLTSFKAHDRLRLAGKLTWGSVKIPQSPTRVLDRRLTAQESGQGPLCADAQQPKGTEAQNKWRTTSLQVQKKAQCTPPGAHTH